MTIIMYYNWHCRISFFFFLKHLGFNHILKTQYFCFPEFRHEHKAPQPQFTIYFMWTHGSLSIEKCPLCVWKQMCDSPRSRSSLVVMTQAFTLLKWSQFKCLFSYMENCFLLWNGKLKKKIMSLDKKTIDLGWNKQWNCLG